MTLKTVTHLNFRGNARAALTFYHSVFGGDHVLITYQDAHSVQNPDEANQIIWGQVTSDEGFHVMAYDVPSATPWSCGENSFFVSLRSDDRDQLTALWEKLSAGGDVKVPFGPSGFSPLYGMVTDSFGITWVVDLQASYIPT
jgi:PhnB protein